MTYWLEKFRQLDMNKEKHRQMLIDTFVNAVFVYDDKLLLTFNFKDGTRTITLSDVQTATNESGSDLEMFGVPKNADTHLGICIFYRRKGLEHFNATLRWSVARHRSRRWRHHNLPSPFRRTRSKNGK